MACSKCGVPGCGAVRGCGSARVGNTEQFPPEYNTPEQIAARNGYPSNWFRSNRYGVYYYTVDPVNAFVAYNQPLTQQAHDVAVLAVTAWNSANALSADMRILDWLMSAIQSSPPDNADLAIAQLQSLRRIIRDRLGQLGMPVL